MRCPRLSREYIGFCASLKFPYVPSTGEREHYCLMEDFESCPLYINGSKPLGIIREADCRHCPEPGLA